MQEILEWVLIKYGPSHGAFELRTRKLPPLSPNKVRVQVKAFGLNYADVMARKGMYKPAPHPPGVLGYEIAGIVSEVHEPQDSAWLNKRVLAFTRFGGYASVVDLHPEQLAELPENLNYPTATALATQYCTAYHMIHGYGQIEPGSTVFQHAPSGGVGKAIADILSACDIRLYGITGNEEKKSALLKSGFAEVFLRREKDYHISMQKLLPGGVDYIFNSVAGNTLGKDMKMLATGGKLFIYGAAQRSSYRRGWLGLLRLAMNSGFYSPLMLAMGSKSIIGVNMLSLADVKPNMLKNTMLQLMDLYRNNLLKPSVKSYPFADLPEAHHLLESGESHGKLCIEW